jgi:hypothetical protein
MHSSSKLYYYPPSENTFIQKCIIKNTSVAPLLFTLKIPTLQWSIFSFFHQISKLSHSAHDPWTKMAPPTLIRDWGQRYQLITRACIDCIFTYTQIDSTQRTLVFEFGQKITFPSFNTKKPQFPLYILRFHTFFTNSTWAIFSHLLTHYALINQIALSHKWSHLMESKTS